jgi:para-aminobenzoate synthetase/4-amino-4-deoxychorismate lyase
VFASDTPVALFDDEAGGLRLSGLTEHVRCTRPSELDAAFAALEAARAAGHWVALAAAYELGHALEPALAGCGHRPDTALLEAWIFTHGERLDQSALAAWLAQAPTPAGLLDFQPRLAREAYLAAVRRVRDYIMAGDCYQANFTFPCTARAYGTPRALYRRLREAQPVPHGALIVHAGGALLSRSPELFVARQGRTLTCRPMKGTAPIDAPPEALTGSDKNRAENLMIVDLIRNDLGRLAPPGQVTVTDLFTAERYPTVWQMTSTVRAGAVQADLATIFRALFPCGSVTGAPKIRAMQIIAELESGPRGIYCGALGWIAPDGDFSFNVPIRTLQVDTHGRARYGTGSGIVFDSDPEDEWRECLLKTRFLAELPHEFELIETLRCEGGAEDPLPWLDDHLQRLADSAAALRFACDRAALSAQLHQHAATLRGPHRLRLTLASDGRAQLSATPLDPLPVHNTVSLWPEPLDADDPLLRHKTTARARYDSALRQAIAAGHFDTLFFNQRGELAEGCRSNIFVQRDGELLTPPQSAGLLNGICRRRLLREGRAREAVLHHADLRQAERLFMGNALRGLVPVHLVEDACQGPL